MKLENGKLSLTTKFCLLLLPAPPTPKKKGTDPPLPQTPAPFRRHPDDSPLCPSNGNNHLKEGTDEKTLVLQPPPGGSKDDRKRHRGDHDRGQDRDRDHKETRGPSSQSDAENGNGDKEGDKEAGVGEGAGTEAGAGAEAGAGGAGAEAGAEGTGGEQPPEAVEGTEPGGQDQNLLTQVAYHLSKWEAAYKVLVDNIVDDLRDYWTRLGIPQ